MAPPPPPLTLTAAMPTPKAHKHRPVLPGLGDEAVTSSFAKMIEKAHSNRYEKESIAKQIEDVQRALESINVEMWNTRLQAIQGAETLWPEPVTKSSAPAGNLLLSSVPSARGRRKEVHFMDFLALREHAINTLQPLRHYNRSTEIYENFLRMVKRSRNLDSFLLGAILYFRYFLKLERAIKLRHLEAIASNIELFAPADDPYRGAHCVLDVWRKDGAISLNMKLSPGQKEEHLKHMTYLREKADHMIQFLGVQYGQILVWLASNRSKDVDRERSFFEYMEIYLFEAIKQVFGQEMWPTIYKELQRLVKSKWFSSTVRSAEKVMLYAHHEKANAQNTPARDSGRGIGSGRSVTIHHQNKIQDIRDEEDDGDEPFGSSSSLDSDDESGHRGLSKTITKSMLYRNLMQMRKNQESLELLKRHRPTSVASSLCARALVAERPASAKMGATHRPFSGHSNMSGVSFNRPTFSADSIGRRTLTSAGSNPLDFSRIGSSRSTMRPLSSRSNMTTTSYASDTLSYRIRVEGTVPIKRRKIFGNLAQAHNAYRDKHKEKDAVVLVKTDATSARICLEATSPLITAAVSSSRQVKIPGFGQRNQTKSNLIEVSLRSKANEMGSTNNMFNINAAGPVDTSELYNSWTEYEQGVQASLEDDALELDLVDLIQIRVNGFRW